VVPQLITSYGRLGSTKRTQGDANSRHARSIHFSVAVAAADSDSDTATATDTDTCPHCDAFGRTVLGLRNGRVYGNICMPA